MNTDKLPEDEQVRIDSLIREVQSAEYPRQRKSAARKLAEMGPGATRALPVLHAVRDNAREDQDVRDAAVDAIDKILDTSDAVVDALNHPKAPVRQSGVLNSHKIR